MLLNRRRLLATATAFTIAGGARAALPVPPSDAIRFKVIRQGSEIGHHHLTFARDGDRLTVTVDVEIAVYAAFIRMFHYRHRNVERWQGDRLAGFAAETNDDGTKLTAAAERNDQGFAVTGSSIKPYTAPAECLCATHWNRRQLDGPMLNPQDGKLLHPKIAPDGESKIETAAGKPIDAARYTLTGDMRLILWYGDDKDWSALSFTAGDGSTVDYRLVG